MTKTISCLVALLLVTTVANAQPHPNRVDFEACADAVYAETTPNGSRLVEVAVYDLFWACMAQAKEGNGLTEADLRKTELATFEFLEDRPPGSRLVVMWADSQSEQVEEIAYTLTRSEARGFCGLHAERGSTVFIRCVDRMTSGATEEQVDQIVLAAAEMRRQKTLLAATNAVTGVGFGLTSPEPPISVSINLKASNVYLGGNGAVFHDGAVTQNDVTLGFLGCYVSLWISQGLDDSDFSSNFGDEINPSAGCAGSRWGLDLDVGVIYVDAHHLTHGPDGDVWGPYLRIARSTGEWEHSLKFEPYLAGGDSLEGGWLIHARGTYTMSIFREASTISISAGPTYDDGAFGFAPGVIGFIEIEAAIPWRKVTFSPSYKLSSPISGAEDRSEESAVGLSMGYSF